MTKLPSKDEGTALAVPSPSNITVTPIGLVVEGTLYFDDWASLGPVLGKYHRGIAWAVGDWISVGEYKFGEMYAQALDTTGLSLGRLRNLKSLCDRVPIENRAGSLSLSHHEAVAPFSHVMQRKLLAMAIEEGLDRDELRAIVAELHSLPEEETEKADDNEQLVIDPPSKPDPDKVLLLARKVISTWHDSLPEGIGISLYEALVELDELLAGEDDA